MNQRRRRRRRRRRGKLLCPFLFRFLSFLPLLFSFFLIPFELSCLNGHFRYSNGSSHDFQVKGLRNMALSLFSLVSSPPPPLPLMSVCVYAVRREQKKYR